MENSIYFGNIMQRTWYETKSDGIKAQGDYSCWAKKENAILYKTKNGSYVDLEDLKKIADYKKVNEIAISKYCETTEDGIMVMPAVTLSEAKDKDTTGVFVDADSLISFQDLANEITGPSHNLENEMVSSSHTSRKH